MPGQIAIIFDCDGVLVDSEPMSISLLREFCARHGVPLTEQQAYAAFLGKPVADAHQNLRSQFGLSMPPINLAEFQTEVLKRFERSLMPVSGMNEALAALPYPKCVASSSSLARVRASLKWAGLDRHFSDRLFSTEMVLRGKPHPDIFLYAADAMGIPPQLCVVVEDSPAGLCAAKAAGMKTVAFAGASHAEAADLLSGLSRLDPDHLIKEPTKLVEIVSNLFE